MRRKASERDQAKAKALVVELRKSVRIEIRMALAATTVQAHARRWLSRRLVLRMRSARTQGQLCARQAAWRARSVSFKSDLDTTL